MKRLTDGVILTMPFCTTALVGVKATLRVPASSPETNEPVREALPHTACAVVTIVYPVCPVKAIASLDVLTLNVTEPAMLSVISLSLQVGLMMFANFLGGFKNAGIGPVTMELSRKYAAAIHVRHTYRSIPLSTATLVGV